MADKNDKSITPSDGGIFHDLANQVKLIFRLIADPRVSPLLKMLPIGSLVYLVFPDLAPGPIDDALVIGVGTYLFVELCPPEIVQEHKQALEMEIVGTWRDPDDQGEEIKEEDIIEGEYQDE
jgi:hypothetical protein